MNQDISFPINLQNGGKELLKDTTVTITNGRKYGIIGKNGTGKTTLLNFICLRKNPELLKIKDIYMVNQEMPSSDKTIYDVVMESNIEINELIKIKNDLETQLNNDEIDDDVYEELNDKLIDIDKKLYELDYDKQESIIKKILHGLGMNDFTSKVNQYSGGWRMRIALACALYRKPSLLLLDEPTNHLELEANIWLINYLKDYKNTIIVISHDIEFLDEVCTNIIHLENLKLNYYNGNYSKYTRQYNLEIKEKTKTLDKIEKTITQMKKSGKKKLEIDEYIKKNPLPVLPYDKKIIIDFGSINDNENEKNLIILDNINFSYNNNKILDNITLGVNCKTRIALVGKNGSGKSTLLKVLNQKLIPESGDIYKDDHIRISYFDQHTFEYLPEDITPIQYLQEKFPRIDENIIRSYLGKIGLEGKLHKILISNLSGGQKVRISLVELQLYNPHVILLDEPTNHLDLQTIEALKESINNFNGAVILISHNIDLIEDTECQVYEMFEKKCKPILFSNYCEKILVEN